MKRFLLACALSFIGSVIALELGAYWWAGLALGFVAGYLGYDLSEVVTAVPRAWKAARLYINGPPVSKDQLRLAFYGFGAGVSLMANFLVLIFAVDYFHGFARPPHLFAAISSLLIGAVGTIPSKIDTIEGHKKIIIAVHPIPLFFWWVPRGIVWVIKRIPSALAIIGRFCKTFIVHVFRYVHSNARLLFGIDVAIGVAVGHFTGSALLGGLAGGAWWLLDWHLVSIKIMGVKPA